MPVGCTVETFLWEGKDYSYPFTRETYAMVNGSFRMNQGCPDRAFSLKGIAASGSQNTRLTFWRIRAHARFERILKVFSSVWTDFLSQADRVSKQLEASSPREIEVGLDDCLGCWIHEYRRRRLGRGTGPGTEEVNALRQCEIAMFVSFGPRPLVCDSRHGVRPARTRGNL